MKKILLSGVTMVLCTLSFSQLNESFTDGDFTSGAHVWAGSTTEWQVVTSSDVAAGATNSFTLRLNGSGGAATDYLSTQVPGTWGLVQTWGFWLGRRGQAATDANQSIVWLWASEADVTSATVDGYRIRFGDDTGNDEIFLEVVTNGVATTVITSLLAVPNGLTDIGFLVRVTRTAAGTWSLFTSVLPTTSGTGDVATTIPSITNTPVVQGVGINTTYTNFTGGYVAVASIHSSGAAARAGAEFDQIRLAFVADAPLPVKFGNITGYEKLSGIQIDWTAYSEENVSHYEIQRSADGRTFTTQGTVTALNAALESRYGWLDVNPLPGVNFYRLKSLDIDQQHGYSSIVKINLENSIKEISVYPNPVIGRHISLQATGLAKGNYTVRISNSSGQQVYTFRFNHADRKSVV